MNNCRSYLDFHKMRDVPGFCSAGHKLYRYSAQNTHVYALVCDNLLALFPGLPTIQQSKTGWWEGLGVRLTICLFHTWATHCTHMHAHTLQELFYLLADAESSLEHEGGVVTTSSLAVELQAGGLTPVSMRVGVPLSVLYYCYQT